MKEWGPGSVADHMRAEHRKGEQAALKKLATYISGLEEKVERLEEELSTHRRRPR